MTNLPTTNQLKAKTMPEYLKALEAEKQNDEYEEALKGMMRCTKQGARRYFENILYNNFGVGDCLGDYNDAPAG